MLIDLDLDYFNPIQRPIEALCRLISQIPPKTPTHVVVEHHRILSRVRYWVSRNELRTPFAWWHIDHHHDFYLDHDRLPYRSELDCANFGYFMPTWYFDRLVWYSVDGVVVDDEIDMARKWLRKHGIAFKWREPRTIRLPRRPRAFIVTISPDYIQFDDRTLAEMLVFIQLRFNVTTMPIAKTAWNSHKWRQPCNWIRVSPLRFHEWAKTRWGVA